MPGGLVARVCVDTPLPHLDRLFDYAISDALDDAAQPGVRVRVRFSGRLLDGWLIERAASSDVPRLAPITRVVSPEPVLTPEVAGLARAVADHWAGTLSDVLRFAVPPRHARVESQPALPVAAVVAAGTGAGPWASYEAGTAYVDALAAGRSPRAVWRALPDPDWPGAVAVAIGACLVSGRGAVAVVPDARDLARLDAALLERFGAGAHVALSADLGPAERYRRWLAVRRGAVRCAVGTRAAAWAPVADLGLAVIWDDGDDSHREPRAPYPHARDVLVLRAHRAGAAALVGGYAPSVEAEALVASRWARPLAAARATVRRLAPRVVAVAPETRLPHLAWQAAHDALDGSRPVLVQVARRGYQPALACRDCRARARCATCAGPLARAASTAMACGWCGRPAVAWRCPSCGGADLRTTAVGSQRTAEELGRAFPGVVVRTSDRDGPLIRVDATRCLVIATAGAEPVADGGYGAVLLLDAVSLLGRADLRAAEEALRRWCAAVALCAPGGRVVIVADPGLPAVQALVRWDAAWLARREAAERAELRLPPAVRMAAIAGPADGVADLLAAASLPESAELLGPVPDGAAQRALVRVPRRDGAALAAALHAALGVRSARKADPPVRVQLDPADLF